MLVVSFTRARWLNSSSLRAPHKSGKAARPDGTYRDHWLQLVQKKKKNLELCVSSLCRDHAISVEKKRLHPDSSSLCKDHANLQCITSVEEKLDGLMRFLRTFGRAVEGRTVISQLTCASADDANSVLVHHELFVDSCRTSQQRNALV